MSVAGFVSVMEKRGRDVSSSTTFSCPRYPECMKVDSPDLLEYERGLTHAGYRHIVGLDEVGRGALAGPIAAAAVALPRDLSLAADLWSRVQDSKTLLPARRLVLSAGILQHATCDVAMIDAATIDAIGLAAANRMVMELALRKLSNRIQPDCLLIDAMTIDDGLPQFGIIGGDARSLSIAAASIVAKVHRDAWMVELSTDWPHYGWDRNKGYGVSAHLAALATLGPCVYHRASFRPVAECAAIHGA